MPDDIEALRKKLEKDAAVKKLVIKKANLKMILLVVGLVCVLLVVVLLIVLNTMRDYQAQQKLQYQELYNMRKSVFRRERKSYATAVFCKAALKSNRKWNERELAKVAEFIYEKGELHYGIAMEEWMVLIRHESKFKKHAKGKAGEVGLFQPMPLTARYIARVLNINYAGPDSLKDPIFNARIGMRYYSDLKEEYRKPIWYISAYCWGAKRGGRWANGGKMTKKNLKYINDWDKARAWVENVLDCEIEIEGLVIPE